MVVKGGQEGFLVECSGPCRARDRRGRGQTLGRVELDEHGEAFWKLGWGQRFRITMGPAGTYVVPAEGRMIWHKEPGEESARWQVEPGDGDYRVTCDQCGRAWVFTVTELTERYDEMARRPRPVAVAGVDVGHPVGQT